MPAFVEEKDVKYYGKFLKGHLTEHENVFYKTDTLEHWGLNNQLNYHTATADLDIGIEKMAFYTKEHFGMAGIYDGNSNDIPIVNTQAGKLGEVSTLVMMNAAEWSYFDLKRLEAAKRVGFGVPLIDTIKDSQEAMGEFINRRTHDIVLYGEPERDIFGLYNQPEITQMKIDVNLYDSAVSPEDIYRIFLTIIQAFSDVSLISNARMQDWKIPEQLLKRLAEPYSALTGNTIYKMLTASDLGYNVNSITSARENSGLHLRNKGILPEQAANRDRIIIKTTTPCLQRKFFARTQFAPREVDSIKWRQISFAATTGLYAIRPNRIMYVDFLNGN